ncbi:MAG: tetratricopeptide repeat protein, partial [Bacteroidota bacterium]
NYRLLLFSLTCFVFTACSSDKQMTALEKLEAAFAQMPNSENGEALVSAYETQLATTEQIEEKITLTQKMATTYLKMGVPEGLQAGFTKLVQNFEGQAAATGAAQAIMDSVLHDITNPADGRLKPAVAKQYISLTEIYAKSRPDATESPEQLYKSGEIARSIGDFQKALSIYSTIENYFPQYEKAPKALFMQAFTYAEDLKNEEEARKLYEAFIEKYPEDDFVDDAQILLSTLGKTDEEIFQALEKK